MKNIYAVKFINACIKPFLSSLYVPKFIVQNVPKNKRSFEKLFTDKLTSCNFKLGLASPVRVKSFFSDRSTERCSFQDFFTSLSVMVAMLHFIVQISSTFSHLYLTEKKLKIENNKVITIDNHHLYCDFSPSFGDFLVMIRESNDFKF